MKCGRVFRGGAIYGLKLPPNDSLTIKKTKTVGKYYQIQCKASEILDRPEIIVWLYASDDMCRRIQLLALGI